MTYDNLFYAKAKDGKIEWSNNRALENYLWSVDKKPILIKIEREKSKRTLDQNAFYWFYLRIIANETGHLEWELHSLFKRLFLPPKIIKILGREFKIPASTKELSKGDFSEYLDKICAETGVPIPNPEDVKNLLTLNY